MVSVADGTIQDPGVPENGTTSDKEAAVEKPIKRKLPESRPLDYIMVKHMGYSPRTKVHRAARAGQRRQRLMLDTGRRIRCKGERYTEVSFTDLFKNFNTLLASVRSGAAEICRPDSLQAMTLEQVVDLGKRLASDYKADLKIDKTLLEPIFANLQDTKVWEEKSDDVPDDDTSDSEADTESPITQDDSNAPLEDVQEDAVEDSVVESPLEDEEVLTEEDLHKKSRSDLNDLASQLGIEAPDRFPNKQSVIDAVLDASEAQE